MRYNTYRPDVYRFRSITLEVGSKDDNYLWIKRSEQQFLTNTKCYTFPVKFPYPEDKRVVRGI